MRSSGILISVAASNDDIAQQILKSTVDTVEQIDKAVDYGFSILGQIISHSDSAAATAEKFGISEGRVDIINKFISEHGDIRGIGPKTREALLKQFKTVKAIREASLPTLSASVGNAKAKVIYDHFHPASE